MNTPNYIIIFISLCAFIGGASLAFMHYITIDFSHIDHHIYAQPSIVLDNKGQEWTRFHIDYREPVSYEYIPHHLISAFLAAEDRSFFTHSGLSFKGIIRSIIINIYHRKKVQGASTITQQLVKLLFFDHKKTFSRKIKEQIIALIIEQQYTKEQILEAYLNNIYFGAGIYGIQAASQRFWHKHVKDLTVAESALLAAIVKSPQRYCPLFNQSEVFQRRNIILDAMNYCGYLTEKEAEYWKKSSLALALHESAKAPYAREALRIFLEDLVGKKELYTQGFIIKTTLDLQRQRIAEDIFKQTIDNVRSRLQIPLDGGMISISPGTGAIQIYVGGYDFNTSQFNRIHAVRQIGSTIKPLLYATALEQGSSLSDIEYDEPLTITHDNSSWNPQNANKKFMGPMSLAQALEVSNNIIAIKTLIKIGPAHLVHYITETHLTQQCHQYPSLALGTIESSLYNVVGMFNIFNTEGLYKKPYLIEWIKDRWGIKIWKHRVETKYIMPRTIICNINKVLAASCRRLEKKLQLPPAHYEQYGKTGTTNDARTVWYAGCTSDATTVIYLGRDDNKAMHENIFASSTAFPMWHAYAMLTHSAKNFATST